MMPKFDQYILVVAFGSLMVFISLLGCGAVKFNNAFFSVPFGILIFVLGFVLFILGLVSISGIVFNEHLHRTMCKEGSSFDSQYKILIDKSLCSEICPCDPKKFDDWKKEN